MELKPELFIILTRNDGQADNRLGRLFVAADKHYFKLKDPMFKPVGRVFNAIYEYSGELPVTVALAALAVTLGQANPILDGTDLLCCVEEMAA